MYHLELVGGGSGSCFENRGYEWSDQLHAKVENALTSSAQSNVDVYRTYGLIRDEFDNIQLDMMICTELGIKASDFKDDIPLLEVCVSIWSTEHPEVDLYYCDKEIEDQKLRKQIASKLFPKWSTQYGACISTDLEELDFLRYAMNLIFEKENSN